MLIAFCGLIGAGKSYAARHLVLKHGFIRTRFAGPLKEMMKALGLNDSEIDGAAKELPCDKLGGKTPRHAMQTLGAQWGRDLIDPELWVNAWAREALGLMSDGWDVVVDDCRFLNEAGKVWLHGGKLIKIERSGLSQGDHVSEFMPFTTYDRVIENRGDPEAFKGAIDEVLWAFKTQSAPAVVSK